MLLPCSRTSSGSRRGLRRDCDFDCATSPTASPPRDARLKPLGRSFAHGRLRARRPSHVFERAHRVSFIRKGIYYLWYENLFSQVEENYGTKFKKKFGEGSSARTRANRLARQVSEKPPGASDCPAARPSVLCTQGKAHKGQDGATGGLAASGRSDGRQGRRSVGAASGRSDGRKGRRNVRAASGRSAIRQNGGTAELTRSSFRTRRQSRAAAPPAFRTGRA